MVLCLCAVCVCCVRKAVSVPVCSRSQWTVNTRGIWQSSRPCQVSLHSTYQVTNFKNLCCENVQRWHRASGITLMKNGVTVQTVVLLAVVAPVYPDTVWVGGLRAPHIAGLFHVLKLVFSVCFWATAFALNPFDLLLIHCVTLFTFKTLLSMPCCE